MRQRLSLRAQAVAWLAQREHSELELRRKLLRRLAADASRDASAAVDSARSHGALSQGDDGAGQGFAALGEPRADLGPVGGKDRHSETPPEKAPETQPEAADAAEAVDAVIRWLLDRGYLDPQRFIDSRVHVRAGRYGLGRIRQELAQHGLALPPEDAQTLRSTEFERAQALWQRRFGEAALTPRDAARQARFLAGRGFSGEVVRQVLRQAAPAARKGMPEQGFD